MIAEIDVAERAKTGATTATFLEDWKAGLELPMTGLDRNSRLSRHYARYNWDRYQRVMGEYVFSDALRESVEGISAPETWLFITEPWCTDAAYSLPVIQAAAQSNAHIDLRFLMRDTNEDVMRLYLTGEARSIPILATFDSQGNERMRWGSKPEALARYRKTLVEGRMDSRKLSLAMVDWYEAEGWLEVERELVQAFGALNSG